MTIEVHMALASFNLRAINRVPRLVVLGSTGSIGKSTLEVLKKNPGAIVPWGFFAGSNEELLFKQAEEFCPPFVGLLKKSWQGSKPHSSTILAREEIFQQLSSAEVDIVLAAIVGTAGLSSVLEALKAGKRVLLANKESVVAASNLLANAIAAGKGEIIPVDSEHSSIYQLIRGTKIEQIKTITITASGGPFLDRDCSTWSAITPQEAVRHPRWNMGAKISVDSATLMNKALELIEAVKLFGLPHSQVEVLVHPQSYVHAIVELRDGVQIAHLSQPDMKAPIAFALNPDFRYNDLLAPLSLSAVGNLTFRPLDNTKFRAVSIARECLEIGGRSCAILTMANEAAVTRFLAGMLTFDRIIPIVEEGLSVFQGPEVSALDEVLALEEEVHAWVNAR